MARGRARLVLRIMIGVIGLLVLVVILLPLLVPREHLRQFAEQQVIASTGGEASLGPVSLRVLPRLRLILGESSVRVTAHGLLSAGQDPGPLLSAEVTLTRLEVDLALWPLLRRQLEFGEVRLVSPRLDLVTSSEEPDDTDLARPIPSEVPPGVLPPPTAMDYSLTLAAVEVRDGEVRWSEEGSGRVVEVRGWQQDAAAPHFSVLVQRLLRLRGEKLPQDAVEGLVTLELTTSIASLDLSGFGETPVPTLADLRLRGALSLPPPADLAEFTIQELSMTGWRAVMSGHATAERVSLAELSIAGGKAVTLAGSAGFSLPPHRGSLVCDLHGQVDLATILDQVEPWLPELPDDAPPLPSLTGSLNIVLAIDLAAPPALDDPRAWDESWKEGLAGKAVFSARGGPLSVAVPHLGEPLRAGGLVLESDLRSAAGVTRLTVQDLTHPVMQGDVGFDLVPAAGDDKAMQARLELPRLDLDALATLAPTLQTAGVGVSGQTAAGFSLVSTSWAQQGQQALGNAPAQLAPGALIPPDLAVDLQATVREIVFMESVYTEARLAGTLRERVIEVSDVEARLGSGRINGRARLDYASDPRGKASWDMRVQEAPAGLLLSPYLPLLAEIWTGTLSAQAAGACDLADPQAILNSLDLTGDLSGSGGVIDLREQLGGVRQYLGNRQDLLRVQYNQVSQPFRIEDGKVHVDGLRIDGRDTDWRGGGWIGLDGTLNLTLNVRLPAGFTPHLGDLTFLADALRDQDGRISLDVSLTGDLRRPDAALILDPAALLQPDTLKDMLKDVLKDEDREQLEKLSDEIKKGAGGLLDRLRGGR